MLHFFVKAISIFFLLIMCQPMFHIVVEAQNTYFNYQGKTISANNKEIYIRVYNVDDFARLYINGVTRVALGYGMDTGKIKINNYLVNGLNDLRFVTRNIGDSKPGNVMTYGYQVWVDDQIEFDEQCDQSGVIGCNNDLKYPGGKTYDKTIKININNSRNKKYSLSITSEVQGMIYLNGEYTGKKTPASLLLSDGQYRIGLGGDNNRYQESTVLISKNQQLKLKDANWLPNKPWKVLLLAIRKANLGPGKGNHQMAYLSDHDISVAYNDLIEVDRRWVRPFSFGLVSWDISQQIIENIPARITDQWDHINHDLFLQEADLTNLTKKYDAIVYFWPRMPSSKDPWNQAGAVGGGSLMSIPNTWVRLIQQSPREVWLHEWLHVAEAVSNDRGYFKGVDGLHGAEIHNYKKGSEGEWLHWYRDYMRGSVIEDDLFNGIPPAAWLRGTRLNSILPSSSSE
jgi:hypothetical protein